MAGMKITESLNEITRTWLSMVETLYRWTAGVAQLQVEELAHRFGKRNVLWRVTLKVEAGECAVLYGANGSGKSTLLSLLATRLRIQQGRCLLDDINLQTQGEQARRRLLFVGHHTHLYGHLSPMENLIFFCDMHQLPIEQPVLVEAVATVGLAPFVHQPIRWFSAGMKKRLALARILVAHPSLLLLDEPYSALDHAGVDWLNGTIDRFQKQGGLVVMASHDPEKVSPLKHSPWRLEKGVLSPWQDVSSC
ncbi:MAG: heme ABC exporter ATP-binding protein CcmA [Magnetococcales bacterium]|nr:heme ABC exporter ATP-binding protein CcmA [Magnetococcales bacterium]